MGDLALLPEHCIHVSLQLSPPHNEFMSIEHREVDGIRGLLNEVLAIAASLPGGRFLWYRGHSCLSYSLVPKLMRDGRSSDEVFDREKRLLTRFRQRSMAYWPAGYPQNDWEHLFAMQHYGMPTRLLDWSENLFVAAHFAMDAPSTHGHQAPCIPAVWCVDPVAWNRAVPRLADLGDSIQVMTTADDELDAYRPDTTKRRFKWPVAMFGAHNSNRIVAQRGTFMVWGNEPQSLESLAAAEGASLWRIQINGEREQLAQQLRHLGFSETMVFPELPALSTELSRTEGWK